MPKNANVICEGSLSVNYNFPMELFFHLTHILRYIDTDDKYSRNKLFVQIQKVENTVTCMQDPEKA